MLPLTPDDHALIAQARDAIRRNYDSVRENHTVGAAVRGENGEEIIPPCGNCRQIHSDYAPECAVIIDADGTLVKILARELLPFAYHSEDA